MANSLAQRAIAFLIDLSERGEIDPWDVNVIDVVDRFLKSLKEQIPPETNGRSPYEKNLSESGQAFLYASMLVLLKADTLIRTEIEEEEVTDFEDPDEAFEPQGYAKRLPRNLEHYIHRRAVASPPEKRQVTLQELIAQLEMMAVAMANPTPRNRHRGAKPHSKRKAISTIAQLAHQENLSEIAEALSSFLDRYWEELESAIEWMDFERLLEHWAHFRPDVLGGPITQELTDEDYRHEKVGVFWGLLFLSSQSKVELAQERFYRDLRVRQLDEASLGDVPAYVLPD
ncbi:MAG: segregation/condensation protein A [Cyanobacteria bacterium P01_F01_bin.13]